jgi:signal transduction histidine kinase
VGAWPWRSALYTATTPVVGLAAAVPLLVLVLPWAVLASMVADARPLPDAATWVPLLAVGAALVGGFGPLLALPVAAVERLRLRLVDTRPAAAPHRRPPAPGPWAWLRTRYTEPATWRELGYTLLLPPLAAVAGAMLWTVLLPLLLAAAPLIVAADEGPVTFGPVRAATPADTVPVALLGVALLALAPYLLALWAGAHGALARALLHRHEPEALRAELVEVTRSRARLVDAFEAERRRIERDLHDGAQQRLVALTMRLGLARLDLPADSPAAAEVAAAHDQAKLVLAELRELIRGIHPQVLTDRGLAAALPDLADRCPVPVRLDLDLPVRPPAHAEATAYFVAAELLTNAARHSGATAVAVSARAADRTLVLEVADDGRGGADPAAGTGLTGLADRLAVTNGRMLLSSPPGGPTRIRVELPWNRTP